MEHKNDKAARLAKRLEALKRTYVLKFPDKCDQIEALFQTYLQSEDFDVLEELRQSTHKLKGSGATYGFGEISKRAMGLEVRLAGILKAGEPLEEEALSVLREDIDQLKTAMLGAADDISS